jgi:tetratricopeptide (TPR) repeat protein
MSTLIDRAVHLLPTWVLEAPIQDVVTLTPPAPELLQQVTSSGPSNNVTEAYRWLWERFGKDDLSTWSDESLRLEFQWREQDWQPPFPLDGLTVDRTSDPELHLQMAKRWVRGQDLPDQLQLLFQLQGQAIDFLTEQRYTEAAALFEFYLKQTPGDVLARNNLGFCLMPLRPEMALHHLESIRLETSDNPTITLINVCTALALLGRHGEALERAEYHWQRGPAESQPGGAYLWRLKDDAIELIHAPDLRLSLAHLAHGLAQHLNLPDRVRRWRERAEALGATAP